MKISRASFETRQIAAISLFDKRLIIIHDLLHRGLFENRKRVAMNNRLYHWHRYIRTTYSRSSYSRVGAYAAYIIQERRWQVRMRKQTFPFPSRNEDKLHTENTSDVYTHTGDVYTSRKSLVTPPPAAFPLIDMINKWWDDSHGSSTNRWNFVSSSNFSEHHVSTMWFYLFSRSFSSSRVFTNLCTRKDGINEDRTIFSDLLSEYSLNWFNISWKYNF